MKPTVKRKIDFLIRALVIAVMIFNLVGPSNNTAKAASSETAINLSEAPDNPKTITTHRF